MFGIGLPELILILGIALIVVGPDKLPEMAKSIAKVVLDLKKTASSLKESLHEEMKDELGQDPWQQKLGDAYPNLPSTSVPEPAAPEVDAVSSPDVKPAVMPVEAEAKQENPEVDAVSPPEPTPVVVAAQPEAKQEKPTG
jgi:sec-independent protein translocase protein TatB